jgi:succinyl-CoA synthetase alpha subunit
MGGDPVHGIGFIETSSGSGRCRNHLIVVIERSAATNAPHASSPTTSPKPVVAYIAAHAPKGKRMGHAGAIITGSAGTAASKAEALQGAGVRVGKTPTEVAEIVEGVLS